MAELRYKEDRFALIGEETVLDGLLRRGHDLAHACRSGVCQACALVCESGELPPASQQGLGELERRRGVFLACQCRPETDLELSELGEGAVVEGRIVGLDRLSGSVVRVRVEPSAPIAYEAGQYLALQRGDGLTRSYSIASVPDEPWLEFHVRRVPGGQMSGWLYDEACVGDTLGLRPPLGSCCYAAIEDRRAPLLLVGVGTGLAPLWGLVREALAAGHEGPIQLVRAAATPAGLYLGEALRALAERHPEQLELRTCVRAGHDPEAEVRDVTALASQLVEDSGAPASTYAVVCGDPAIVKALRFELFLAGVASKRILADAFIMTAPRDASSDAARALRPARA